MPNRSDNDIKNHWNSCLKKRLERNGIDPMTHQPIINNLNVKMTSFDKECGGSSSSTASSSSSSSSGSTRLINKIATGISSRQNDVDDRIKNILSDPRFTSINGEEEKFEELKIDREKIIGGDDQEDDFLMWDEEKMRRFMEEIGVLEFETTSYNNGVYNSSLDISSPP